MHRFVTLARSLIVCGSSLLALPAWAQSPERFRIVNIAPGDTLSVRAAPDAAAAIRGTIPPGATGIERVGDCKAWCQIRYGNVTGWVDSRFLQADAKAAGAQTLPATQETAIADCNSDEHQRRLRGCSLLIDRKELAGDTLALAYSRRSDSYLDRRDFDRAIADRLQALAFVPGDADHRARLAAAYFTRGEQHRTKGDDPRAIADYTEALRYDTGSHAIIAARAAAYARSNHPDEALADYRTALKLEPSSDRYRLALGALLHQQATGYLTHGEHDKAVEVLTEAIRLNETVALFYVLRGDAYVAGKKAAAALADFDKALTLEPGSPDTLVRRGQLHFAEKRTDLAIADLSQALKAKPDQPDVRLLKALALEEAGRLDEAAEDYRAILKTQPTAKEAKAALERIHRTRDAKKQLTKSDPLPKSPSTSSAKDTTNQVFENRDIEGADLRALKGLDQQACSTACEQDGACRAYSFDKWNRWCFLKSGAPILRLEPNTVSTIRSSLSKPPDSSAPLTMQRYRGKAFPYDGQSTRAAASFEACESRCKEDATCIAFSYFKQSNQCRLMASVGEYFANDKVDSGVKRQDPGGTALEPVEKTKRMLRQEGQAKSPPQHGRTPKQKDLYPGAERREPPAESVPWGKTVLVDDGTCPSGQIKEITGGNLTHSIPRRRKCLPR